MMAKSKSKQGSKKKKRTVKTEKKQKKTKSKTLMEKVSNGEGEAKDVVMAHSQESMDEAGIEPDGGSVMAQRGDGNSVEPYKPMEIEGEGDRETKEEGDKVQETGQHRGKEPSNPVEDEVTEREGGKDAEEVGKGGDALIGQGLTGVDPSEVTSAHGGGKVMGGERKERGEQNNISDADSDLDQDQSAFCPECEARKIALNSRWGIASAIRDRYAKMQEARYVQGFHRRGEPDKLGALFVDFENIYLSFRDLVAKPLEMTIHVLTRLRDKLQEELHVNMVMGRAYASWEYGASRDALSQLSLLGIVPQYVLSRPQKSSADLKLSIDLMEVLLTRDDIKCFIIAGGDRDYMPIVEKIKERANEIIIVSPGPATSGDLIALVGEYSFIDATLMLPSDVQPAENSHTFRGIPIPVQPDELGGMGELRKSTQSGNKDEKVIGEDDTPRIVVNDEVQSEEGAEASGEEVTPSGGIQDTSSGDVFKLQGGPSNGDKTEDVDKDLFSESHVNKHGYDTGEESTPNLITVDPKDEIAAERILRGYMHEFAIQDLWRCVGLIIRAQGEIRNNEIWVGPFLKNYMNEEFDFMNNTQRKRLLALMEEVEAVAVDEKMDRMGEQTYSVLSVNWESPIMKAGLLRTRKALE